MVSDKKYTSPGVRQSLKILAWIARHPGGLGFNELRERVFRLPPSTLTRHLKVLAEENWVHKDEDGLYRPGPAYLCAVTNMTGKPNPEGLIKPVLEKLADESGHSAAFAEWDRGGIRFSIKKDKSRSYCYPGERDILRDVFIHPFGVTALAFLPESVVEWNRETRTDELAEAYGDYERGRKELDRILPDIRERGLYSALYGCQRICAPIRYKSGDLAGVLGLSILGKGEGREPEKLMEAVREIEAQDL